MPALVSGAVLWLAIRQWAGIADARDVVTAAVLVAAAAFAKQRYWHRIDAAVPTSTLASATGLGRLGAVSTLYWPHTEDNYLLKEMGYVVARRHAAKLRRIALVAGFALPLVAVCASLALGDALATALVTVAALSLALGLVVERWLFFAEAKHAVMNYYGR